MLTKLALTGECFQIYRNIYINKSQYLQITIFTKTSLSWESIKWLGHLQS